MTQKLATAPLSGQNIILRADLNAPIDSQYNITNWARIDASIPTIKHCLQYGANTLIISHQGRPSPVFDAQGRALNTSSQALEIDQIVTQQICNYLRQALDHPDTHYLGNWLNTDWTTGTGKLYLGCNTRLYEGETQNHTKLSQNMLKGCDVLVFDAFATAHRAHSSTAGLLAHAPSCATGHLIETELKAIQQFKTHTNTQSNAWAIVSGSKVSTKIDLLQQLTSTVQHIFVGGAMANTFFAAKGHNIGQSMHEANALDLAQTLLNKAGQEGRAEIHLPIDCRFGHTLSDTSAQAGPLATLPSHASIFDTGPKTDQWLHTQLQSAQTIFCNGPVGVFENPTWATGTRKLLQAIADSPAYSLLGGGDTLTAIEQLGFKHAAFNHVSTGGGALLAALSPQGYACQPWLKQDN